MADSILDDPTVKLVVEIGAATVEEALEAEPVLQEISRKMARREMTAAQAMEQIQALTRKQHERREGLVVEAALDVAMGAYAGVTANFADAAAVDMATTDTGDDADASHCEECAVFAKENDAGLWWLSYASTAGFRGVVIVEASSFEAAAAHSRVCGWSPGGGVQGQLVGCDKHRALLLPYANRRLSLAELSMVLGTDELIDAGGKPFQGKVDSEVLS